MKIIARTVALLLAVLLILPLCGCGEKCVMQLDGKYKLEADVFSLILSYCKTQTYSTYLTYLQAAGEDVANYDLTKYEFWEESIGDDPRTLAQIVMEEAVVVGKSYLSAEKQFDEYGLKFGKEDEQLIDDAVDEMDKSLAESGSSIKEYLKKYDITLKTYKKYLTYQYKINKLKTRLLSPGGEYEITDEIVADAFEPTVEAYGYSNVNHIFLYSVSFDQSGNPVALSDEDYNKVKAKAQQVYDAVISGEAEFEEFLEMSQDEYSPDGYLISIDSQMTEDFVEACVKMKIGEVRLVESEGIGFHIIKKYELTDEQKTEIEDTIRENLESEAEERIIDKYEDSIKVDEEILAEFDAVHAKLFI